MQEKCGIYKITNKINNKSYIGKSKHIYERWRQHHTEPYNPNARTYNTIFYRAIRKYGLDQFQFEILEECSEEQLNEKEKYWIKKYNTYILEPNSQGYNMTEGGEMTSFQLQYDINLIEKLWKEGKTHQEIREIVNCGQQVLTRYLDYLDIDVNERRRRGHLYKAKAVLQFKLDGTFIREYPSISEAARQLQIEKPTVNTSNICYACNNKIGSAYGYIWRYKNNDQPKNTKKVLHRQVNQYNLNGEYIQTFPTQEEARESIGVKSSSSIVQACSGRSKTAGGYIWRYYDESLENPYANLDLSDILNNLTMPPKDIKTKTKTIRKKKERLYQVDQFDLHGNYIATYSSMIVAAHAVGLKHQNNIWKACNGDQKTAGGYIWKYHIEHMEVQ